MKTFMDLIFRDLEDEGQQAKMRFPNNGRGISVIKSPYSYGYPDNWEVAILKGEDGEIDYDSGITDDVIGNVTDEGVTEIMKQIQELN